MDHGETRATRTIHPASRRAAWSSQEGPRGVQSGWLVERPGSSWDAIRMEQTGVVEREGEMKGEPSSRATGLVKAD